MRNRGETAGGGAGDRHPREMATGFSLAPLAPSRRSGPPARGEKGPWLLRWVREVGALALATIVAALLWVAAYAWIDPPLTGARAAELAEATLAGEATPPRGSWRQLESIAPALRIAIVVAEDPTFCGAAPPRASEGAGPRRRRVASEPQPWVAEAIGLPQRAASAAFIGPGHSWGGIATDQVIALLVETLWRKPRVMEVYLNTADFGHGLFGAEAASAYFFDRDVGALEPRQAALLAALLDQPEVKSGAPERDPLLRARMEAIEQRMAYPQSEALADCVL